MSENIDNLLRDFLEEQAKERSQGITLTSLYRAMKGLADDRIKDRQLLARALADIREEVSKRFDSVEGTVKDVRNTVDRYGRRIQKLEGKVSEMSEATPNVEKWEPDQRDITGSFAFQEIMAAHHERKSDARWLKRKGWEWAVAGIGALVLVIINIFVSLYIATHK